MDARAHAADDIGGVRRPVGEKGPGERERRLLHPGPGRTVEEVGVGGATGGRKRSPEDGTGVGVTFEGAQRHGTRVAAGAARASCLDTRSPARLTYNHMVVGSDGEHGLDDGEVDRIFRALADATRRDIVRRTLAGEANVSELARAYDMSFAAVQKHVAVLEEAGLVTKRSRGRERLVLGNPETIRRAQILLDGYEHIWRGRVARLDALLAED